MNNEERIREYIPFTGEKEVEKAGEVIRNGWVSPSGSQVEKLEEKMCDFTGAKYATATDSGTAALHLAIEALNLSPKDEVIIPDFTYGSTGLAVTSSGVTPKIVDIERSKLGVDPESVRKHVNPDTKAILVAHMFGKISEMDRIQDIADEHNLYLIEDAAQSMGACLHGQQAGSIGDIGCFSFAWSKNITTGKGGMVVTSNKELHQRIKKISNYGRAPDSRYEFSKAVSFNYRMDNIRAAIGVAQLERFNDIIERKREIFKQYREELDNIKEIDILPPEKREGSESVPTIFGFYTNERNELNSYLEKRGIETRKFFPPLHEMPAFSSFVDKDYPVSEKVAAEGIALPSHPKIGENEINHIANEVKNFFKNI